MASRLNWRPVVAWLALLVMLWFVGGKVGLLVGLTIGVYVKIGLEARHIIAISVVLIGASPLAMILQGLTSATTVDPRVVQTWSLANNLAFAGVACLVVGVVLAVPTGPLVGTEPRATTAPDLDASPPASPPSRGTSEGSPDPAGSQDAGLGPVATKASAGRSSQGSRAHLVRGGAWTTVNVMLQAITGAGFWLLASKLFTTTDVGFASALFSSLLFVNFVTGMGLPVTIPLFAGGGTDEDNAVFTYAILYTTATSAVGTIAYLTLITSESVHLLRDEGGIGGWLIFFVSVVGASVGSLADVRLMVARRWVLVLVRSNIVGFARLAMVFLPHSGHPALWLFAIGSLPVALTGFATLLVLPASTGVAYRLRPITAQRLRDALRFASVNFVGTLLSQAPVFVLPVIVLTYVTVVDYAQFFLAWSAASTVYLFPISIASVLLVESAKHTHEESRLRYLETLGMSLGVMLLALVGSIVGRSVVVGLLGGPYQDAADLLPRLIAGSVPWAFTSVAFARARARKDSQTVLATSVTLCVTVIFCTVALVPVRGVQGAALAWAIGQVAAAVVAFVSERTGPGRGTVALPQADPGDPVAHPAAPEAPVPGPSA